MSTSFSASMEWIADSRVAVSISASIRAGRSLLPSSAVIWDPVSIRRTFLIVFSGAKPLPSLSVDIKELKLLADFNHPNVVRFVSLLHIRLRIIMLIGLVVVGRQHP